jgi:hypothetical protein
MAKIENVIYMNTLFQNVKSTISNVDFNNVNFVNNSIRNILSDGENLLSVSNINDNITDMSFAFQNCNNLTSFSEIPQSVTNLYYTFSGCSNLTTVAPIPYQVHTLEGAFSGCSNLTFANIEATSVSSLENTFSNCRSLEHTPTIPNHIINLNNTFSHCYNLKTVTDLPQDAQYMHNTFQNCENLTTVPAIPEYVTDISGAFANCSMLERAPALPNNIYNMDKTFWNCPNLKGVRSLPTSVQSLYGTFANCSNITELYISSPNITNATEIFNGATGSRNVYIPTSGIKYIAFTISMMDAMGEPVPDLGGTTVYVDYACVQESDGFMCAFDKLYDENGNNISDSLLFSFGEYHIEYGECTLYFENRPITYAERTPSEDIQEQSQTEQAFRNAGYDENGTKDGVYLKDINNIEGLEDYTFEFDNEGIVLTKYKGVGGDIVTP